MFFLENVRRWNKERNAIKSLHQMSNRELADIGINRGEIKAAVRKNHS